MNLILNSENMIASNAEETKKFGADLARKILSGEISTRIICLSGDLGAGKTTFTQGFLEEIGAEGPYTSPTFLVMKEYDLKREIQSVSDNQIAKVYHFDTYRVEAKDILELGWEEMIANRKNVIIVEWAERIERLIPADAIWMEFEWKDENERRICIR